MSSMRTRMVAGISILSLVTILLLGLSIFLSTATINSRDYELHTESKAKLIDGANQEFFRNISNTVNLFTTLDDARAVDDPRYEDRAYSLCKLFAEADSDLLSMSIGLENGGGYVRFPEKAIPKGYDARQQNWYKGAMMNPHNVTFSEAWINADGNLVISASKPFYTESGEPAGVASSEIDMKKLAEAMEVVHADKTVSVILVDSKGKVIINQFEPSKIFIDARQIGFAGFAGYAPGDKISFSERFTDGVDYRVWSVPIKNELIGLNYLICVPYSEFNKTTSRVLMVVLLSILVALAISFVGGSALTRSIVKPLVRITAIARNISEGDGDLTARIPVNTQDELGQMSRYFNETIAKIGAAMKSVIEQAGAMRGVGENLAESMNEAAGAVNQIDASLLSVQNEIVNQSAGVNEMQSTIKQIVGNIERLTENIESQAASVVESSSSIEEMVANINSVTQILAKNAESVQRLGEAAESGRTAVDDSVTMSLRIAHDSEGLLEASSVIQNIANQTNLLAMNAAIEAAHAGDSGKGFAVVADEIRKLAETSNAQGKNISNVLKKLKENIARVSDGSRAVKAQFESIAELTRTVSEQENVIKNAMDEQSAGGSQVLDAIRQINDVTVEVKDDSSQMYRGSKEIIVEMDKLASVTSEIDGSMKEMTKAVNDLNKAMQRVNEISRENRQSILIVTDELGKFRA